MWYYNAEVIRRPKALQVGGFTHPPTIFKDKEKLSELGIKPYREVMPDGRYFGSGAYTLDTSGDEVVGTYQAVGRDTDVLKKGMLTRIKNILTNNLLATDWYYLRKLRTGTDVLKKGMLIKIKNTLTNNLLATDWYYLRKLRTGKDVPSDIQDYSDALYAEYDSKKTEINAMTKLSEVMEFESRPHKLVSKVRHINSDTGKVTWGPETETKTMNVNMCLNWSMSPDSDTDPSFVSLTAD